MRQIPALIFIVALFFPGPIYCQVAKDQEKNQEIIDTCNVIMKNIYNDIWRIREFYKELKDFSPQNYSDNPEMPRKFARIKAIRIKNKESSYVRNSFFHSEVYRADADLFYIFFSTDNKAFGARSEPLARFYLKEFGFYLLVYSRSNNHFLRNHMFKIIKKNARLNILER